MEYSISTLCLFKENLTTALDTLAQYTTHVELMNETLHQTDDVKFLTNYPLSYSIHAPYININLSSPIKKERNETMLKIEKSINLAAEIDAERVVIHPGKYYPGENREKAVLLMHESLEVIQEHAKNRGVNIAVENMSNETNWGINLIQQPEDLIQGIDFCLDIGHANICGCLEKFLQKPISHIHLHNNFGKEDSHSALDNGNINMKQILETIKKNNITHPVIECNTLKEATESLRFLSNY